MNNELILLDKRLYPPSKFKPYFCSMSQPIKFALIGVAGYIAPRHLAAIAACNGELVAALDPHDCVGILDSYFPEAAFFTEFERFDRHLDKLTRLGTSVDYIVICSPNYLHDAHIRFGLRNKSNIICEKPLVINPWNLDALIPIAQESGKHIFSILQLRLHPAIIELKEIVKLNKSSEPYNIDLTYITSRGSWYYTSWKADAEKSGGIATNIGIHFFDMLLWVFGEVIESETHIHTHDRAAGYLKLKRANVKWFLSINANTLPESHQNQRTFRSICVDGKELEFSHGFADLHIASYKAILEGNGFGPLACKPSIELCSTVRTSTPTGVLPHSHHLASNPLSDHPFKAN